MQHQQVAHCVTDQPISIEWKCHSAKQRVQEPVFTIAHTLTAR
jgi:hypothetical protein